MPPDKSPDDLRRALPSVERVLSHPALGDLPRETVLTAVRGVLQTVRAQIQSGDETHAPDTDVLAHRVLQMVQAQSRQAVRRTINATGILLHTNLGRATLAPVAARAAFAVGGGHAALEVDSETGGRGNRQTAVSDLLCRLTGCEAALVVNNNAAATFLAIAAHAAHSLERREVILSRGQMVEIGGQFRLPDVIESAGAVLREVGTTNRTRIGDYEKAIGPQTAMLLRVHPSNYHIAGFVEEATLPELVALGKKTGVLVGDDIGSGALVDFAPHGLLNEPMAQNSVALGADLIWFSGDKLLGGPQSGVLLGTKAAIAPLISHPLYRALRPDKMTIAALEATLRLYQAGRAWEEIPILRRIARPAPDVLVACGRVARALRKISDTQVEAEIIQTEAQIGGGSLPGQILPSWAVAVSIAQMSESDLARHLRNADVPVYGRIEKSRLLLDLRAVDENEEAAIAEALHFALTQTNAVVS